MLAKMRKAVAAAVGAGVSGYAAANADSHVTTEELVYLVTFALVTGIVTYWLKNRTEETNNG